MTALHQRIKNDIEEQILSGTLAPGARLPTENELMEVYGCARMTISKALTVLAAAGMIDRRKRAGSFVAQPRLHSMVLDVPDLPTEVRERGESYSYQLLRRSLRFPSPGNVREETLASRGLLLELEGVHSANNSPLAFEHRQVSVAAVPAMADADFSAEPPGSWLLRNVPWTEAETRISATSATAELAEKLHIDKGAACLSLERWTWRGGDQITFVQQSFVGTRYDLIARFGYGGR